VATETLVLSPVTKPSAKTRAICFGWFQMKTIPFQHTSVANSREENTLQ